MESLMKADIFFFISSVTMVVLAILVSVLLFYLIKARRNLHLLSEALKGDFKESEEFIAELKERLEGNMIFRLFFPLAQRSRRSATKKDKAKNSHK
ncbi:MAG: hypothetical protein COZ91_02460 [Candidatus Nealsonbacteria bacterium CG_4_8_14_3_um_filter_39_7]|uniref:Uncharacterized protein n=1 Tax=Candidatus Nealsonbacteria bacterium CG23_combo_of_CG06-09_8_20_14_all_39_17 TaxID=1974722 RepID=A0A2G9YWU2_9BACT|nr:MAG: hypothetical protein COX37_01355 [Candidatus Nealsonbacteria bacterium CG23_combo_of_CG06-09_8_20_14_all_39_17]PIU44024.1 MAG: hypothetical protein COS96_01340 [Candidatus Nealsonbacteria bacterium CG07_land_8_20_14_0_80_39_13]PIW91070.1 MAG: hypothetical protein COZ91_02460 [Candidatus Nealsonbacteria bacterium CG_4_8_14_3_um_filter_39_7]